MATHSNILAWKISWAEEPGRLRSIELHTTEEISAHILNENLASYSQRLFWKFPQNDVCPSEAILILSIFYFLEA